SDEPTLPAIAEPGAEQPDVVPAYAGPTPANPFGGHAFDIFDVLEQAERQEAARRPARTVIPAVAAPAPVHASALDESGPQSDDDAPTGADAEIVNAGAAEPVTETAATGANEAASLAVAQTQVEALAPAGSAAESAAPPTAPAPEAPAAEAQQPDAPPEGADAAVTAEPGNAGEIDAGEAPVPSATPPLLGTAAETTEAPAPELPEAANDAAAEPLVKPIVIGGAEAPPVEKKRGWWRR
ncbi:MAG: hypothetical protein J0H35_02090, partial [Rhodospirillales bacterium]|nr:hypothetical protein [Rhodospirillales bacterium]